MNIDEYKNKVIKRIRFGAAGLKKEFWDALGEIILAASEAVEGNAETIDRAVFNAEELRSMGYDDDGERREEPEGQTRAR